MTVTGGRRAGAFWYRHGLETSTASIVHDATEVRVSPTNFSGARRHVDCADCHNSHGAAAGLHNAGSNQVAPGVLAGVPGVEPTAYPAASTSYPMASAAQTAYAIVNPSAREYQGPAHLARTLRAIAGIRTLG